MLFVRDAFSTPNGVQPYSRSTKVVPKYRGQRRRGSRARGWFCGRCPSVPRDEKSEKNRKKTSSTIFHSIENIIAIFQKRYGTSPCALHAVTAVPPFGTRPANMYVHARRRRDSDCTGEMCAFGGAFARSKMATLFSRFFPGFSSLFSRDPSDFERVLDI